MKIYMGVLRLGLAMLRLLLLKMIATQIIFIGKAIYTYIDLAI